MSKKILALLSFTAIFLLTACQNGYDISRYEIISDVEIIEIKTQPQGRGVYYEVTFEKNGKKEKMPMYTDVGERKVAEEVSRIKEAARLINEEKKLRFSLVTETYSSGKKGVKQIVLHSENN